MKKILTSITLGLCIISSINAQEKDFRHLSSMQCRSPLYVEGQSNKNNDSIQTELSVPIIDSPHRMINSAKSKKSTNYLVKVEAYLVQQIYSGGYNFHTADYYDGTRVVTCLDGDLKGYQGVSVNGILQTEGFGAEWHNGYFIHYYERGKITSYPKKQTIELY